MTENLLSSLDIKIAQSRAETIATKALADQQKQERFNMYHAFSLTGKVKGNKADKQQRQQQHHLPQSGNTQTQVAASLGQASQAQSIMTEVDPALLGTARALRSQGRKTQTRNNMPGDAQTNEAAPQQDDVEGMSNANDGTTNSATRIRL